MVGLVIMGILAALAVLSLRYGVDSRSGSTDRRYPAQPVGIR
jgi:type II secretory pathway pseudopilin PulG